MKARLLNTILLLAALLATGQLYAQASPFTLRLVLITVAGLPGIQSYAHGQSGGKWLIVGGRLDGLHRPGGMGMNTPFAVSGNNNQLVVVDPLTRQYWASPLTALSADLQAQLSATNALYYQTGDIRYVDTQGHIVDAQQLKALAQGAHTHIFQAGTSLSPGAYLIRLSTAFETVTQRVIIHP